jgi:hypothetical protein
MNYLWDISLFSEGEEGQIRQEFTSLVQNTVPYRRENVNNMLLFLDCCQEFCFDKEEIYVISSSNEHANTHLFKDQKHYKNVLGQGLLD